MYTLVLIDQKNGNKEALQMVDDKQKEFDEIIAGLYTNPDIAGGNLQPALRTITETSAKAMDVDRVAIWRPTQIEIEYQCVEAFDRSRKSHPSGDVLLINQYPNFLNALLRERFISIPDAAGDPRTAGLADDYLKPHHMASVLGVPFWVRGRLAGFISFEKSKLEKKGWRRDRETFACQIADLVVQTIYSAQSQELKQQLDQYTATLTQVIQETDPDIALHDLVRYATQVLDCESGLVFLTDHRTRRCCSTVSYNAPPAYAEAILQYGEDAAGRVAETGQTILLQDYQSWPGRSSKFDPDGFSDVMAIPLVIRGNVRGVVEMMRQGRDRPFVDWDQRMLEMMGKQFSVFIDQIHQRDRRRLEDGYRQALQQMVDIASRSTDLSVTFDSALSLILECMALTRGSIHTQQLITGQGLDAGEEAQIYQALDRDGRGFRASIPVNDWENYHGAVSQIAPLMKRLEIRASVFVPILVGTNYLGALSIHTPATRTWTESGIAQLETFARLIAVTADKLTSHQYLDVHSRLMIKLNNVNRGLNRLFSFDEAVSLVGQSAIDLLDADQAAIFLRNPDGSIDCPWSEGLAVQPLERSLKSEGEQLSKMVVGYSSPLTVTEIKISRLPTQFKKLLTSENVRSMITLPLVYSRQVIGAITCFFKRPRELTTLEKSVLEAFTSQAAIAMQNAWMHEQMEEGYTDVALALARAMDARDSSISDSSLQVAEWAEEAGRKLGLSENEIKDLHWAALLHNLGKVSVPDTILQKPGTLNDEEWGIIHRAPLKGEEMIQPLTRFHDVGQIIRHSHERFDGSGYPDQYKGEEIPLAARILSVADAFTSMLDDRPYRKARNPQEAMTELEQGSGKQFDPQVVSVFVDTVRNNKGGNGRRGLHHN
jgi:HD-GYP domain-containing protein (c-di-GMP phosphodiesterase class II)